MMRANIQLYYDTRTGYAYKYTIYVHLFTYYLNTIIIIHVMISIQCLNNSCFHIFYKLYIPLVSEKKIPQLI